MTYVDLPVFQGPNFLPQVRMDEIMSEIKQTPACFYKQSFPKLIPWCQYIEKLEEESLDPNYTFIPSKELAEAEYDPYLIDLPWMSSTVHVLMIIVSALSIFGVLGNFLCLPWLNSVSNRTGATLYMTIAAISDIFYTIGVWLIYSYQLFHRTIDQQLQVYQDWTVNLVPIGLPITNFFNLLSTWLLVALLIDRLPVAAQTISPQAELRLDAEAKAAVYQKRSRCRYTLYIMLMVLFFCIYTVPMCFEYGVGRHKKARKPSLVKILLSFMQYRIAMMIVLKPIVEFLLPFVLLIWYLVLIRDKKYSLKQQTQRYFVPHLIKNWEEDMPDSNDRRTMLQEEEMQAGDGEEQEETLAATYMLQPVLDLSFLECKRWRNESIVSRMAINISLIYLLNMLVQAMSYFVRIDTKSSKSNRELREIFFYLGLVINLFVVSMKPITYLLTSKAVIKEFKEIQLAASTTVRVAKPNSSHANGNSNPVSGHHHLHHPASTLLHGSGWRIMINRQQAQGEQQRILA